MNMCESTVEHWDIREAGAFGLSRAAIMLDQARQDPDNDAALVAALNHNLELWIAIRSTVQRADCTLPKSVEENLVRLSNFVAETTFKSPAGLSQSAIDTLININLQISEGLLEGLPRS